MSSVTPGRETDARIAEAIGWKLLDRVAMGWRDGPPVFSTTDPESPTFQGFEPSCNPAHALAAMEATGTNWDLSKLGDGSYNAYVGGHDGFAPTLCLAASAAILAWAEGKGSSK